MIKKKIHYVVLVVIITALPGILLLGKHKTQESSPKHSNSNAVLQANDNDFADRLTQIEKKYSSLISQPPLTTTQSILSPNPLQFLSTMIYANGNFKFIGNGIINNGLTLSNLSTGILHTNSVGSVSASLVNLGTDVTNTLPVSLGGTGQTGFTANAIVYGNGSSGLTTLAPGNPGDILSANGSGSAPAWIPMPTQTQSSSFDTLNVGNNTPFTITNPGKVSLAYVGDSGYLSSTGGALFLNNTQNIGTGIGIYSNAGSEALGNMINVKVDNPNYSQAAFYMNYDGNSNAVEIINNSSDSSSNALSVTSNDISDSTVGIIGNELAKGTLKITHNRPTGGTDSNASGLSIDLKGSGTRAQGIYVDSTESGGTLGNLLRLRNSSIDKFVVDFNGNVTGYGNITQGSYGTDTTLTKFGNTTGDQFFIGTTGAFRIQRAVSNSEAFRVQINGDTQGRWRGTSDGSLQWGDGTNAQDVILKRGSAGILTLTGGITINNGNNAYNTVVKGVNDSNLLYVDATNDRIGIGISTPVAPLHINKNALGNATFIVNQLGNGNIMAASSSGATVFTLDRSGNVRTIGSLCVKATITTNCAGSTPGTIYAGNTTVQSADLAENYISSQTLTPGDIVMPAGDGNNQAIGKTTQAYQSQTIGIVSTKPGVTLNSDAQTDEAHPYLYPVALQGRVSLKVSTINGDIASGDLLTTSSIAGVAMKATKRGTIVAKALEGYKKSDSQTTGTIMAFVSISYHGDDVTDNEKQNANIGQVTLPAGVTEIEVKTPATKDAKLFVEPEDIPVATATKKKSDDTFIIKIGNPQSQDLVLSWWLN